MKYKPYLMKDVYAGEALEKFRVISTFAGGGGSSTGYRLAGGKYLQSMNLLKRQEILTEIIIQTHLYLMVI
tara:strand:- start:3432 stop:3644 length:213 start_codon:yes stop_codon:yes gene_type:complete